MINKSEGRFGVTRITGPYGEKQRNGFVPCDGIKLGPKEYVPVHIIISERVSGQIVCLDYKDNLSHESEDQQPYYDAGPSSRFLDHGANMLVKDVNADFSNVNLLGADGASIGYGKICICYLSWANIREKIGPPTLPSDS